MQTTFFDVFDAARLSRKADGATCRNGAAHAEQNLGKWQQEFLEVLRRCATPATAQEVAAGNESLRKRAAELVRLGYARVAGVRRCRVTNQKASVYEAVN